MIVLNYSIFGSDNRYFLPLIFNIDNANTQLGDEHKFVIHHGGIPPHWLKILTSYGDRVVLVAHDDCDFPNTYKMMWRYQIIEESFETCHLFRDSDSLITSREVEAINHWRTSQFNFLIIRDHPLHVMPILGGLFGCKGPGVALLRSAMSDLLTNVPFNEYGADQVYLDRELYRRNKHQCLIFSSCVVFPGENVIELDNCGPTIGGYSDCDTQCVRVKSTMLPRWIFSLIGYRGSRFRLPGWWFVKKIF